MNILQGILKTFKLKSQQILMCASSFLTAAAWSKEVEHWATGTKILAMKFQDTYVIIIWNFWVWILASNAPQSHLNLAQVFFDDIFIGYYF